VSYPDFEEFIGSLNARRARYLIVGGYAVGLHARPRATKDLDVLVDPTRANAARVRAAIVDVSVPTRRVSPSPSSRIAGRSWCSALRRCESTF